MWSQIQKAIEFDAVKREASLRRRDKPLAFYELHGQVSTEDREKVLQAMDTRIVANYSRRSSRCHARRVCDRDLLLYYEEIGCR